MASDADGRERIAILGGGIAALTTAYELSRTPELRARYAVTLYQMGWRLGGKLASGRQLEPENHLRNVEHGLHVWFGFYDNAFNMYKEVFDAWKKPAGCPWKTYTDAFSKQSFTPLGEEIDGKRTLWNFWWPEYDSEPGGDVHRTPWESIEWMIGAIKAAIEDVLGEPVGGGEGSLGARVADAALHLAGRAGLAMLREAHAVAQLFDSHEQVERQHSDRMARALSGARASVLPFLHARASEGDVDAHHLRNLVDVGIAFVLGVLNPAYGLLEDMDFDKIDHLEFREWLIHNGGDPRIVHGWSAVHILYDTMFEYTDGDLQKPDYAAGVAARAFIRIAAGYKGAVMWLVNAGMGETVIGPLYDVLCERGVKFEFFHKLKDVELSPDGNQVRALRFDRQVEIRKGPYRPTFEVGGLTCWPAEPFWKQIVNGSEMKAAKVDWECTWNAWKPCETRVLEQGVDFDRVVLGVSLGAFKKLNAEPSICQQILDRKPDFARMTQALELTPSVGIQFWCDPSLVELGWTDGRPAAVGWSFPNDVWADMSPVLAHEPWPPATAPKSVHYFCGVLGTDLFRRPSTDLSVPARALDLVRDLTLAQFQCWGTVIWPKAADASGQFDWNVLHATTGTSGRARIDDQWLRANVDPTECCVSSPRGSTKFRMLPERSGVTNLVLTGCWTYSGLNTTCVEGAVMSGMLAARAVSGEPEKIVGEYYLTGMKKKREGGA